MTRRLHLLALTAAGRLPAQSPAPRRLAIVLGNDSYKIARLDNAVRDAKKISAALRRLGFTVRQELNLNLKSLTDLIDALEDLVTADTIVFFYYAGHGIQLAGENFLIPTDYQARSAADAPFATYAFNRILKRVESKKPIAQILVLDACRNNPFQPSRGGAPGLAPVAERVGTIVSFATADGSTASDSGLFAEELVRSLAKPERDVRDIFREVKEQVYLKSGKQQLPYIYDGLTGPLFLKAGKRSLVVDTDEPAQAPPPFDARPVLERRRMAHARAQSLFNSLANLEKSLAADHQVPRPSLIMARDNINALETQLDRLSENGWSEEALATLKDLETAVAGLEKDLFRR